MKLIVNQTACIGAGNCAQILPKVFGQRDDDGTVILLVENPEPAQIDGIRKAVKNCPSGAIRLDES